MNRLLLHAVFARLGRYKAKTALMGLGIASAVLATVTLQVLGVGASAAFTEYLHKIYPADTVVLAGDQGGEITLADLEAVRSAIPEIVDWDPLVRTGARTIKNGDRNVRVGVTGYSESAPRVRRRGVQDGEFFTSAEIAARGRVALLGSTTAAELFGKESPVGAELFIDNLPFEVRGVLETIGTDPHGGDLDATVWIPFTTAMDDLLKSSSTSGASLLLNDPAAADGVGRQIEQTLRERHAIPEGYVDDFFVTTPRAVGDRLTTSLAAIDLLVLLVAATVFVVAGLIVVGVMLTTVKQRSAEIGLRKALGARARDLRVQIVLEVLTIAVAASLLGLVAARVTLDAMGPALLDGFGIAVAAPSPRLAVAAIVAAVVTGMLSSVLPALRIAKLDPIEVLR